MLLKSFIIDYVLKLEVLIASNNNTMKFHNTY